VTARPYDGIRIVDLAGELGAYCTRLFADLGAEVIRVEPLGGATDRTIPPLLPGRGAERSGVPFAFLAANKKSVVLDVAGEGGRAVLRDLVASAQIVVYQPDAVAGDLLPVVAGVPGARVVTVISWFGLGGPYGDWRGCDLVAQALGGIAWLSGVPGEPPLRIAGEQSWFVTSLYAAVGTALALADLERCGAPHMLDVSAQECIAHSLQNAPQVYDLEGRISRRGGEGTRDATEDIFACRDGFVFLAAPLALAASWRGLVDWMAEEGSPAAARFAEADWQDRPKRTTDAMRREFKRLFEAFIAHRSKAELRDIALARKIVLAPVSTVADTAEDPQLLFRRYFQSIDDGTGGPALRLPGAPYKLSEPVWSIDRPAPPAGRIAP
jgi:benzylsuccinate CoA-transferase BbsE subunit